MAKLLVQKSYEYQYAAAIKVRDINYGGHLGNDAVVGLLHEARIALLQEKGMTEVDLGDGCTGIIMSELSVNFKKEGLLHDEIIIHSHINDVQQYRFTIHHKITRGSDIIALAETELVTYDYQQKKISPVPDGFI